MLRLISLIVLVILGASGRQPEQQVSVPLPDGVPTASCTAGSADGGVATRGRALLVQCPRAAGESARCDFPGAEPRDVALDVLCRDRALDMAPADVLPFEIADGPRVRVEWMRIPKSGEPEVLAVREFSPGVLRLPVAKTSTRFLRFSWDGGSIVTVPSAGLSRDTATRIAKPRAGGELLGLIKNAVVLPDRYRLESANTRVDLRPVLGTIGVPGLPPGSYKLVPEYAGGIHGDVLPLRVEHGRSTIVVLEPEDVGAVEAVAGPAVCAETNSLAVTQIVEKGRGTAEFGVARAELRGDCAVRVSGLPPGRYRFTFDRPPPGFSASADVEVSAQNEAQVRVEHPVVHVFGTVLVNKKPPLDLTLRFRPVTRAGPSVAEALVGSGGIFDVTLPGPGEYHVVPVRRSISLLGSDRTTTFEVGPNEFNLSIVGGSIAIKFVNWDKSSPVTLQLDSLQHELNRSTQSEFMVRIADPDPVVIDGISFGSYRVKARQERPGGDVLVAAARQFTIDESDPSEELELTLGGYDARLVLRTSAGEPVRGATAQVHALTQLEEVEPGVYVISGKRVVPGDSIQIFAPGFAPTCRVAPAAGAELVVVADPGVPTLVKFTHPRATKPTDVPWPPGQLIMPGAACSVSLRGTEYVAVGYEPEHSFVFFFPHFPRHPAPEFRWGGFLVTGAHDAEGVLRVIMPEKR